MSFPIQSLFAAVLLASTASAPAAPGSATVVAIRYDVDEQSAERVEQAVLTPLMQSMRDVPRAGMMHGSATHRLAALEVAFEDGAGEDDLAAIIWRLDRLRLDAGITIEARSIELRPCRLSCSDGNPSP